MTEDPFSPPNDPFAKPTGPPAPGAGHAGALPPNAAQPYGTPQPYGAPQPYGTPQPYGGFGYPTSAGSGLGGPAPAGYALADNGRPIRLASRAARIGGFFLSLVLIIVTLGIGYLIWTVVLWDSGRTPAKQILNQRVVSASHGTPATWGHMAVRDLLVGVLLNAVINVFTLSIYGLVDACFVFSADHRRLTDRIAQTFVAQE